MSGGECSPRVLSVTRSAGVAGSFALRVLVQYPGEAAEVSTFVGSVYGGPIVLVLPSGLQSFVSSAVTDRIGSELNAEWVARFFAPGRGAA